MPSAISIHAAREGGDSRSYSSAMRAARFQSTPPVKAATGLLSNCRADIGFQSTPPVKAATILAHSFRCSFRISIHAAREGGDYLGAIQRHKAAISIHAAREGGDNPAVPLYISSHLFQSTPPVKAATQKSFMKSKFPNHFNPRRP